MFLAPSQAFDRWIELLFAWRNHRSAGDGHQILNACGQTSHPERRQLLTNHDLLVAVPSRELRLGLNFATTPPELFAGAEMGEDALRVLNAYITEHNRIRAALVTELPHVRAAAHWATTLLKTHKPA